MTAVLTTTFILAALLAKGYSLSCMVCVSMMGSPCTEVLTKCDGSSDRCITVNTETISAGQTIPMTVRGCGKSSGCQFYTLSSTVMSLKSSTGCCTTDGCTPDVPKLPASNTTKNGVICRACAAQSSSCYTSETMACTGEEKKCIRYAVSMKGQTTSSEAIRGCATQSLCDIGSSSVTVGGTTMTTDLACTDSSIRLQSGIFLPAVAALLLLKTVF